jgi:hypothetical protein
LFREQVRPPSEFNADVNSALDGIVARALSVSAGERYSNAMEMLEALETWRPGMDKIHSMLSVADVSKAALGAVHSSPNKQVAQDMARQAFDFKKQGRLAEAADTMEEAFNKWPDLRQRYSPQVRLWRCGISM